MDNGPNMVTCVSNQEKRKDTSTAARLCSQCASQHCLFSCPGQCPLVEGLDLAVPALNVGRNLRSRAHVRCLQGSGDKCLAQVPDAMVHIWTTGKRFGFTIKNYLSNPKDCAEYSQVGCKLMLSRRHLPVSSP